MINELIKKLRKAADALDSLLDGEPKHNKAVEKAIRKSIAKRVKPHWTQLPKNKAKMKKAIRKMRAAKSAKV
jgi:ElaB/YqjD/DUF883 family membrane-anchored ribosome-binding protein